jgi:putative DNA primase/helicase
MTFDETQYSTDTIRERSDGQEILGNSLDIYGTFSKSQKRELLRPITDRARQDRCAKKLNGEMPKWAFYPLDENRIKDHLDGNIGCGIGFIKPGESVTQLALFDLDSHYGETPFSVMLETADRLCAGLEVVGLRPAPFRSSGGSGVHLWLKWDTPQDAHSVRHLLAGVLDKAGFSNGAGGVGKGQVEVFPKQDVLTLNGPGSDGNMAVIPFWNKSAALVDEFGLGLEIATPKTAHCVMWRASDPVPPVVNMAPVRPVGEAAAPDSIGKIRRALAAVAPLADKLSTTSSATDYDTWLEIAFATHDASGGHEDGYTLFKAWSDLNPTNASRRKTRATWENHTPVTKKAPVTRATLYRLAHECDPNWDAPTADGFEDEITEPHDSTASTAADNTATSDVANARRLARRMAGEFVYVHGGHGWCKYRKGVYAPCSRGEQMEAAKTLGPLILREATSLDPEKMKKTMAQASRAMSAAGIAAALSLAQSDPQIAIDPTDMDSDPDLLNAENCIIHLPTGEALPHSSTTFMGRQCSTTYAANAPRPLFNRFMLEISKNDPEWVDYMQRLVGYTISGRVNEEIIIFLLGGGANGKSVFANIMRRILNSYAGSVPANFLMVSNRDGEAATPSLARLPGVRMAQANEVEAGSRLSAQAVKVAASSDAIAARHLHKAAFEFVPTHTLWVRGNHKPIITDTDDGIWRRVRLVPFDRQFGPAEKDVRLEEKLMTEAPGILAWMVEGHREYLRRGLTPAKRVADASVTYRKESDLVAQWISERAERVAGGQWLQGDAYQNYQDWCREQGLQRPMTKRSFTLSLAERGITAGQETAGDRRRIYVGLQPTVI